jgi:pyruvate kinase
MSTHIVCTLGPATETDAVLCALLEAGMSFARLNFSHGEPAEHRQRAEQVRRAAQVTGRPVQLIQDLQGPKIRTVRAPYTELRAGEEIILGGSPGDGRLLISEPQVLAGVDPGQHVFLDDGAIELESMETTTEGLRCRVLIGGAIEGNQGVVFPDSVLALPALTEKDVADAAVGRQIGFEWVALSFVQRWEDLETLRGHIRPDSRVIAKIETRAALDDLTSIVAGVDAAMIARGDLGVTIPRARVPLVQKDIIRACRQQGTASIVATEMLLSMVRNPHPTRAEVADVATAVLDGCNAVMLSEETAIGAHPVQAVTEMRRVIDTVEASDYYTWRENT